MPKVRLFGPAAEAAGRRTDVLAGATLAEILTSAGDRYGSEFTDLLPRCRFFVNSEPVFATSPLSEDDEVAVLPPVSGGS